MEIIKYENKSYVNGEYVLSNAPIYSKGCRSSRDLIKKKNIDSKKYIYARLKDNEWIVTDGKSAKFDKVFISKLFIKTDENGNVIEIETRSTEKYIKFLLLLNLCATNTHYPLD